MATILYFDCFSGIYGDMVLGALLDAGLPLDALSGALGSLAVPDFEVEARKVLRAQVSATKFHLHEHVTPSVVPAAAGVGHSHGPVHGHDHGHSHDHRHGDSHTQPQPHERGPHHEHADASHPHRSLPEIFALIDRSALAPAGRDRAKAMFRRLAEAEAAIH